jgi:hypothetical protein
VAEKTVYRHHHIVQFTSNIGVSDAQHGEAFPLQCRVSRGVSLQANLLAMLAAVDLDRQSGRVADAIDDEFLDRRLSAEMKPARRS